MEHNIRRLVSSFLYIFFLLAPSGFLFAQETNIPVYKIGVLANQGKESAHKQWDATAEELGRHFEPQSRFEIVALSFDEINAAVKNGEVDFLITNPAQYVKYEVLNRVQSIATRNVRNTGVLFGSVVFAKSSREDINTWSDLKGKSILAVDQTSFGGWLIAVFEFKRHGIDPKIDFRKVVMAKGHSDVVIGILRGDADVGVVRTGVIQEMIAAGKMTRDDIRVIELKHDGMPEDFPYFHSTTLYPEWPFVKLSHVPDALAKNVVKALFSISSDSAAAVNGDYTGWTVSSNYTNVHECLKALNVIPYEDHGKLSWKALWRGYYLWIISILFFAGWAFIGSYPCEKFTPRHIKDEPELSGDP